MAGLIIFVIIMAHIFLRLAAVMSDKESQVNLLAFGLFWGLAGLLIGDCFDTLLRGPGVAMELFWAAVMIFRISKKDEA